MRVVYSALCDKELQTCYCWKIMLYWLGGGPFLRSGGTTDHHTLFLIQAPAQIKGVEHISFHLAGPSEVMAAGNRFQKLGH